MAMSQKGPCTSRPWIRFLLLLAWALVSTWGPSVLRMEQVFSECYCLNRMWLPNVPMHWIPEVKGLWYRGSCYGI